jgi:hypothetical protein
VETGTNLANHRICFRVHAQALQVLRNASRKPRTAGAGVMRHQIQNSRNQRFGAGCLGICRTHRGLLRLMPRSANIAAPNPGIEVSEKRIFTISMSLPV